MLSCLAAYHLHIKLWLLHLTDCPVLNPQLLIIRPPSVLWRWWLGGRKGIQPVKNRVVGCWHGFVCSEMQTCIRPSWCHCHSLYLASVKSRLLLPFWYWLTRVVPEKGPLNGCVCMCIIRLHYYANHKMWPIITMFHGLCLLVTPVCPTKMAEPIEMLFGMRTWVNQRTMY